MTLTIRLITWEAPARSFLVKPKLSSRMLPPPARVKALLDVFSEIRDQSVRHDLVT